MRCERQEQIIRCIDIGVHNIKADPIGSAFFFDKSVYEIRKKIIQNAAYVQVFEIIQ